MEKFVRELYRRVKRDPDLVVTLAVGTGVVILHLGHFVDTNTVGAAILAVLMLLVWTAMRDRDRDERLAMNVKEVLREASDSSRYQWYAHRSKSTWEMIEDSKAFKRLVFIGVSHGSLARYLKDALKLHSSVHWQVIEVYFAATNPAAGSQDEFKQVRSKARQDLAALFTDPDRSSALPTFETIRFFEYDTPAGFTGALFFLEREQNVVPTVAYLTHSRSPSEDLNDGLTLRLESSGASPSAPQLVPLKFYEAAYQNMRKEAWPAGSFTPTAWDRSAAKWSEFARSSNAHQNSIREMVELAGIGDSDRVLDLACGSGEMSAHVLTESSPQELVLLDSSAQMIRLARKNYTRDHVRFALCGIPSQGHESIDIEHNNFSIILIHQSLDELVEAFEEDALEGVAGLANWCFAQLAAGGKLLIAAHNSTVETPPPRGFRIWKDPFVAAIKSKLPAARRRRAASKLQVADIEGALRASGFTEVEHKQSEFPFTMVERLALWGVRRIAEKEFVGVDSNAFQAALKSAESDLRGKRTMPRTTVFWLAVK